LVGELTRPIHQRQVEIKRLDQNWPTFSGRRLQGQMFVLGEGKGGFVTMLVLLAMLSYLVNPARPEPSVDSALDARG